MSNTTLRPAVAAFVQATDQEASHAPHPPCAVEQVKLKMFGRTAPIDEHELLKNNGAAQLRAMSDEDFREALTQLTPDAQKAYLAAAYPELMARFDNGAGLWAFANDGQIEATELAATGLGRKDALLEIQRTMAPRDFALFESLGEAVFAVPPEAPSQPSKSVLDALRSTPNMPLLFGLKRP